MRRMTVCITGVKAVVIIASISKFDIDLKQPGLDKLKIHNQPTGAAVAVNERMDPLKAHPLAEVPTPSNIE